MNEPFKCLLGSIQHLGTSFCVFESEGWTHLPIAAFTNKNKN